MPKPSIRQSGLTLVELMVTLAVLAILLSIAVPSFQSAIATSQLTSSTNDLIATLAQARMEALRQGKRVTVCISSNGTQCATSGTWQQGWITFTDTTRSGTTANVDNGEAILHSNGARQGDISVAGSGNTAQYISFGPEGRSWTMSGAAQTGTIRVCSTSSHLSDASRARDLTLVASGKITMEPTGVSSSCPAP
ncbi:MAG: hypothetical protein CVU33_06565 [Betaproteobacteria bacterium HGW-Betaproteobacteria-6]|jgi:type IV fimbrial biogenesis protein FimT|nr:MAG: hypothetical protein CVU33_06565 [Betaproteobacteria bacterium HGW-Betaproteobacteria-6]PKO88058.1 MAG: hypothetical protein CVU16_14635 [Betaproteobacteria bacterium HGW-Betaproteobacteria-10]